MADCPLKYELVRKFSGPVGAVTVTIKSADPINEADYFLLRRDAALSMAECLVGMADVMKGRRSDG